VKVVVTMRVVGLILVIALLTISAAISRQFTTKLHHIMMLLAGLGVGFTLAGLTLSYLFNLTSGAIILLVAGVGFLASTVYRQTYKT
jgi:zinc transport system permease protein